MPNSNYVRGRALEYQVMKEMRADGYTAMRTSGSHGFFDVIAVKASHTPIFIQCKLSSSRATAERIVRTFMDEPPLPQSDKYVQWLWARVKGDTKALIGVV